MAVYSRDNVVIKSTFHEKGLERLMKKKDMPRSAVRTTYPWTSANGIVMRHDVVNAKSFCHKCKIAVAGN